MGNAWQQIFITIASIFTCITKFSNALNNIAEVAEETSALYAEESAAKRELQAQDLKARIAENRARIKAKAKS